MNTSSRFSVAIHILSGLYIFDTFRTKGLMPTDMCVTTSRKIAESVNTNPVVIRRLLGQLRKAGLVESHAGAQGGFSLARPAAKITLCDVYHAVEEGPIFHMHYAEPNEMCRIGCCIPDSLESVLTQATDALDDVLSKRTISSLGDEIMANPVFQQKAQETIENGMVYKLHL